MVSSKEQLLPPNLVSFCSSIRTILIVPGSKVGKSVELCPEGEILGCTDEVEVSSRVGTLSLHPPPSCSREEMDLQVGRELPMKDLHRVSGR